MKVSCNEFSHFFKDVFVTAVMADRYISDIAYHFRVLLAVSSLNIFMQ